MTLEQFIIPFVKFRGDIHIDIKYLFSKKNMHSSFEFIIFEL